MNFVEEQVARRRQVGFARLMDKWNKQNPDWKYIYPSRMERDYQRTARSVFLLDVRPQHGPGPGSLGVLERTLAEPPDAPSFFIESPTASGRRRSPTDTSARGVNHFSLDFT